MAGFPFDIAREHPLAPPGDEWWQPMTDDEADEWTNENGSSTSPERPSL